MSRRLAPEAAEWLALAAAPTFATLAVATAGAGRGAMNVLCQPESGSPWDGMLAMYLLMSAFHLSPRLQRMGRPAAARFGANVID